MSKILIELKRNWRIIDKDGKEVFDSGELECDSYVGKMADLLYAKMAQTNLTGVVDITGATTAASAVASTFDLKANSAETSKGLVVGTGSTAVAIGDYQLGTQINHAATALNYGPVNVTTPNTSGSTRSFTVSRSFLNASTATASTINESGIYAKPNADANTSVCVARDVESPAITIGVGNTGTLTYTIGVTVS